MNFCQKCVALCCLCITIAFTAIAQLKFEKAVLVTKENGLPVKTIYAVCKGEDGFVWIGTSEGLCRFDGQQLRVFQEGPDLKHTPFDNNIIALLPVKQNIWIGTSQGISVLNTKDLTFRHYQLNDNGKSDSLKRRHDQEINVMYLDKSGKIWIGTRHKGVYLYDEKKDDFRFFSPSTGIYTPLVPSLGSVNTILGFAESGKNDSVIWAGSTAGLWEINRYNGNRRIYTYPQKSKDYQIALNAFRRPYYHDDGLLYVGSWAAGVNVFDPATKTFTPLQAGSAEGKKLINSVIGSLIRKSEYEFWISSAAGLAIYDTRLKDVSWYQFNNPAENELYGINFIDDANRAWYVNNTGLSYFDPAMQQFSTYSFKHLNTPDWAFAFNILSDRTGQKITVCPRFADALFHFDRGRKEWTRIPFPQGISFKAERDVVRGFVQLPNGEYVISADRGIFLYSEKQRRISVLKGDPSVATPTRRGSIILDRAGNLWITDDIQGLIKWKPGTSKFRSYQKELKWNDTVSIYGRLDNLFEDSRGNIWFQRGKGLGVWLAASDSILNFIYAENEKNSFPLANSFAEDRKGRIWVSGGDNWLGYALSSDPSKGVIYKVDAKTRGLNSNFPKLATDPNGEVWGFTARELVKINPDDLSFSTYPLQYGVDWDYFFHFSFLPTGEMVFGGRNDITITDPSRLRRNGEIPVPYITELLVLNQHYDLEPGSEKLKLTHKQNYFSIGFSAIAYTMPKDVKFRYRLSRFDNWTLASGRRFANYTNVPGGDYVFQLQAANSEGVWNEKILELPVHITTPFWFTWWFRIGVVLAVVAAGWSLYRYRLNQLKKKQKLKSEYEKKLANVEMSALLAQMNPHFLFNSLNSIDSYIIRNESRQASEYLNNFARLMRLILQNSRSNYISLKDELEALDLYLQMESLRFKNKFSYSIKVDEDVDTSSIVIPPMLIQPYVENAIWHGLMHNTNGKPGQVELQVLRKDDNLVCLITDNGIGRKKADELKAKKQNNHKRSMGMQITRDRIEIINKLYNMQASVHIHDLVTDQGEAAGTQVELTIPV